MLPEYLSASRIKTWLLCPQKYKLQYVDRVPWQFYPSAMLLGTAIHRAIETFYSEWQKGKRLPLEEMKSAFSDHWRGEIDGKQLDTKEISEVEDVGTRLLSAFHSSVKPCNVIAIEDDFRVPIVNPDTGEILPVDLVGRIDLIETDDQGQPVIVDHKCLSKRPSDSDMEYNVQLWAYAFAARMRGDIPEDENVLLRIDAIVKLKAPVFDQRFAVQTPQSDINFFELANSIVKSIDAGIFPPNPGWQCYGCQVRSSCILVAETAEVA